MRIVWPRRAADGVIGGKMVGITVLQ